jgi:hypothetical protein
MLGKRAGMLGLCCIVLSAFGCTHEVQPRYPPVPLLVSKKPIEPKTEPKEQTVAMEEPALPLPPSTALASLPPDFEKYVRFIKRSKGSPAASEETPRPAPDSNSP